MAANDARELDDLLGGVTERLVSVEDKVKDLSLRPVSVGGSGTGVAARVALWSSPTTLSSDAGLTFSAAVLTTVGSVYASTGLQLGSFNASDPGYHPAAGVITAGKGANQGSDAVLSTVYLHNGATGNGAERGASIDFATGNNGNPTTVKARVAGIGDDGNTNGSIAFYVMVGSAAAAERMRLWEGLQIGLPHSTDPGYHPGEGALTIGYGKNRAANVTDTAMNILHGYSGSTANSGAYIDWSNANNGNAQSVRVRTGVIVDTSSNGIFIIQTMNAGAAAAESWRITGSGLVLGTVSDAGTNTTPLFYEGYHKTSGTAAAGFGLTLALSADSDNGTKRRQADIIPTWATATDASRKARVTLNVYDTATREALRCEASGSAAMIGFLGAAAVIKQATITQTYSTTSTTHAADTSADFPAGGTGTAAGGWDTAANRNTAITRFNALRADVDNAKNVLNSVIDALQAYGLLG